MYLTKEKKLKTNTKKNNSKEKNLNKLSLI